MRNVYSSSALRKLFLLFTALGLLQFWYRYLEYAARGRSINWLVPFIDQLTGNYVSLPLLVFLVTPVALQVRPDQRLWTSWLPLHLGTVIVFSILHTTMIWGSRLALYPLFGLGAYDYGIMPIRYAMEFPSDVVGYTVSTAAVVFFWRMWEANARELQMVQLQADLARAQLESLTLQLQPHFLFNALNAVAATIYEDARKADIMLARLADYLRRTLKSSSAPEVPLAQELEMLHLYVSVMKARFEDNLQMEVVIGEGLQDAMVPQLILQPVVENAIQHGFNATSSKVSVKVSAARSGDHLILSVRDHGRGIEPPAQPRIGLANTQRRLDHLHGSGAQLRIANAQGGGTEVEIRLPFQVAVNGA